MSDLIDDGQASPLVRISQRPSKSCTECIRRKTRCNKRVPCEQCTKRGVPSLCHQESQFRLGSELADVPNDASTESSSSGLEWQRHVTHQIEQLRARVTSLESEGGRHPVRPPMPPGARLPSYDPSAPGWRRTESPLVIAPLTRHREALDKQVEIVSSRSNQAEDAATTLEYFALGLDRRLGLGHERASTSGLVRARQKRTSRYGRPHVLATPGFPHTPDSVIDALLPRPTVAKILSFAEAHVLWQHCCVFFPDIWSEVEDFWSIFEEQDTSRPGARDAWERLEPTWLALLYVIMGIAVHQMGERDASVAGLSEADRLVLPNALISAAEDALHHGNFMSTPTMWTVQTIAILTLCGHNVCESDLLSSLLAIGIRMAQTLGLHSLAQKASALQRPHSEDSSSVIEVEVGKRVWWALVQEDWFAIPFCGVWSIQPDHFDTPMPSNSHDSDLMLARCSSRPDTEVTVALGRFSSQMASIMREVFHSLRHLDGRSPAEVVNRAVEQIDDLLRRLPTPMQRPSVTSGNDAPDKPVFLSAMRHYIIVSAHHKLLVVHRALVAHSGTEQERIRARTACTEHAQAILRELEWEQHNESNMQSFWTIPYHGLAASVVLVLDLITLYRKGDGLSEVARRRRSEVLRARSALERLSPTSRIARRGLRVISDLLQRAETMGRGKKRNSAGEILHIVRDIAVPANDDYNSVSNPDPPSGADCESWLHTPLAEAMEPKNMAAAHSHTPQYTPHPIDSPTGADTIAPDLALHMGYESTGFSQQEANELLLRLQETLPDVGRLFDGTIGSFS